MAAEDLVKHHCLDFDVGALLASLVGYRPIPTILDMARRIPKMHVATVFRTVTNHSHTLFLERNAIFSHQSNMFFALQK